MRGSTVFLLLTAVVWFPAEAAAQEECELDRSRQVSVHNRGTPFEVAYIGGPVLDCPNGVRITADSAVFSTAINQVQFLGRVRFSDALRQLDADQAQYMIEGRHLAAQGSVVLIDHENGSTIHSPSLDYLLESEARPEPRIEVYRGRPRTTLVSAGEAGDTTVVDADALSIIGQRTFIGRGDVVLRRGELTGSGGELEYDQATGSLRLMGAARMVTAEHTLEGATIVATLASDTLREVTADGAARLQADELDVDAPHIRIYFEEGQLDRFVAFRPAEVDDAAAEGAVAVAASPDAAPRTVPNAAVPNVAARAVRTGEALPQASVRSPEFFMIADSLNVRAPRQQLERLVAVGLAFAERIPTDSAEIAAAATLPPVVQRDWVRGDTIVATFVARPDTASAPVELAAVDAAASAADTRSARREVVLDSLTVYGGSAPASSAYRVRGEDEPRDAPLSINYLLARQIRISFSEGAVQRVEAEGEIRGVHLRPNVPTTEVPTTTVRR